MKISYNWLNNRFFKGGLDTPEHITQLLTFGAFEVESLEKHVDDFIFDIKVLPNRAHDCLSHHGIAREVSLLSGKNLAYAPERVEVSKDVSTNYSAALTIAPGTPCTRAAKRLITGVKVGESPEWLKNYLLAVGQKPINNVVDAANFVMLETGQPVHTFDFEKIAGGRTGTGGVAPAGEKNVVVRNARAGETVACLDGKTYTLDEHMVVIADDAQALDIAGVKGGAASGISADTTNVLISACNFDAVTTRVTSKKLGLRTDASQRFENGITAELVPGAIELLSALIQKTGGDAVQVAEDVLDVYPQPEQPRTVSLALAQVKNVLGVALTEKEVGDIFTRMNFVWKFDGKNFAVTIPFERLDLALDVDLIEEIERLIGYDKLPSTPLSPNAAPAIHKTPFVTEKIRRTLTGIGFSEVQMYALVDKAAGDIELANPPAADKKFLRRDLATAFAPALERNAMNADLLGLDRVKIFEIGTVFASEKNGGEHAALALGVRAVRKEKDAALDAVMNETLTALAVGLGVDISVLAPVFTKKAGNWIAEINLTTVSAALPAPAAYEFSTGNTGAAGTAAPILYKKISPYPFIVRDIAVFVPVEVSAATVLEKILPQAGELVVNHYLFDTFEKSFPDGTKKISYGVRLIFQSSERTLTDDEVNASMEQVTAALNATADWTVR